MNRSKPLSSSESRKRLPLFAWILYGILVPCVGLYIAFLVSPSFSDLFNRSVSPIVRGALSYLTGWIPFSLAEYLLLILPLILFLLIRLGIKKYSDCWRDVLIFCATVLSVASLIFSSFVLGFAPAYRGTPLEEKLELDRRAVSAEELYETAHILAEAVNTEALNVGYSNATDFSVMPYGFLEMNDKLMDAYATTADRYDFVGHLRSRLKPVMLSRPMSYTHITGIYTFFTGEANLNVDFPDYTLPFTAAHELSHQRGIAREDEANFMAFLVCLASDDPYIRYSGYLNLYEYVASALYSASPELYWKANAILSPSVKAEMNAYSDFFDRYRDSVASEVSETVNNATLVLHGTEGVKSYGMVVELAVAYYLPTEP